MQVTHGIRIIKNMKFQKAAINNLCIKKNHWMHITCDMRNTKSMKF